MDETQLLKQIEDFAKERDIAPATVTSRAVDNSRLHQRLKDGQSCTFRIAKKLLAYIEKERAKDGRFSQKGG